MTNMVITPKQYQGKGPEDPESYKAHCKKDSDCLDDDNGRYGHGTMNDLQLFLIFPLE